MRNGPTKTAVITSTIDIDIGKNDLRGGIVLQQKMPESSWGSK